MKKILFVEDEGDQVMMVKTRLESCGYKVVVAFDGEEGIKKVKEEKPDLVLLDIVMPKMNGYQVCDYLKNDSETCNIPVIVITASGVKNLEERCVALGVQEIIKKPYESSFLAERIAFHLGE